MCRKSNLILIIFEGRFMVLSLSDVKLAFVVLFSVVTLFALRSFSILIPINSLN